VLAERAQAERRIKGLGGELAEHLERGGRCEAAQDRRGLIKPEPMTLGHATRSYTTPGDTTAGQHDHGAGLQTVPAAAHASSAPGFMPAGF
jgi:hypothetical protein